MAKWITTCEWNDVPHLDEESKKEMLEAYLPHEVEAREKGIPTIGAGKIFPIPESEFVVDPFEIPAYWPRVYGMDVGWNWTAAVWAAYDEQEDIVYLYREYKAHKKTPLENCAAIRQHSQDWIPGVVDPAAQSLKMKKDGISFLREYRDMDLEIYLANNSVDAGLLTVLNRLSTGRLKVFSTMSQWLNEFRVYRRDDRARVVKKDDDLMDCTRYLCMSGLPYSRTRPNPDDDDDYNSRAKRYFSGIGKNPITGY